MKYTFYVLKYVSIKYTFYVLKYGLYELLLKINGIFGTGRVRPPRGAQRPAQSC